MAVRDLNLPDVEADRDGRQSDLAFDLWRGAARMLRDLGFACVPEVTLKSGRRADLLAIGSRGEIWIIEVKSSLADFRADAKWHDYLDDCDAFAFCVGDSFPQAVLPEEIGLIVADRYGAAILREPVMHKLSSARRRSITTLVARTTAQRLHALIDPTTQPFGAASQ